MSLNLTFKTDRNKDSPNDKTSKSIKSKGKSRAVAGGTNWNNTRKNPKAANSKLIIINAVNDELTTIISLLK